jgi:hypothetical protein
MLPKQHIGRKTQRKGKKTEGCGKNGRLGRRKEEKFP